MAGDRSRSLRALRSHSLHLVPWGEDLVKDQMPGWPCLFLLSLPPLTFHLRGGTHRSHTFMVRSPLCWEKGGESVLRHLTRLCPLPSPLLSVRPSPAASCFSSPALAAPSPPADLLHGASLPFRTGTSQRLPSAFHPLCLEPSTVDHVYSHGFHLNPNTNGFHIRSPCVLPSTCDTFFIAFPSDISNQALLWLP